MNLAQLLARMRQEAGIDITPVPSNGRITVTFLPRRVIRATHANVACFVVPGISGWAEFQASHSSAQTDWSRLRDRDRAAIFAPSDASPQEVRDCLHEEMAQAMGPLNDLYRLPDSVFNDDNFNSVLTGFDMLILRLHYAPELRNGMNEAEVAKRLPGLLARMNPAGESFSGAPKRLSPRIWISAVETAFGPGGSQASRSAGARRMLSVATAQGWNDGRLAFSYYAVGRTNVSRDPKAAVDAFLVAGRIYRSMPDGAIHAAHVDMQLAAIALAAGQNAQVLGFADRAIPVVKKAENAALLATLMLIKAEALDNLGQTADAQALRLDSLGWARYGFGSEYQVRARMSEIATLGAQGLRG